MLSAPSLAARPQHFTIKDLQSYSRLPVRELLRLHFANGPVKHLLFAKAPISSGGIRKRT